MLFEQGLAGMPRQQRNSGKNNSLSSGCPLFQDGTATYARYGPETAGRAVGKGEVSTLKLPKVAFDSNGKPTEGSFSELANKIADFEGEDASSVRMAFFETSEADTAALDAWIAQKDKSENGPYFVIGNNCMDFCLNGLSVGRAITGEQAAYGSVIPNISILQLWVIADAVYPAKEQKDKTLPPDRRECPGFR